MCMTWSLRSPLTQDISAPIGWSADAVEKRMNMHFGGKKRNPSQDSVRLLSSIHSPMEIPTIPVPKI